jgi:hypothetical protein
MVMPYCYFICKYTVLLGRKRGKINTFLYISEFSRGLFIFTPLFLGVDAAVAGTAGANSMSHG